MEKKRLKAALYIRVSTQHQVDKDSLPFQRQELINYAKYALNIEDYEIFEDAGYSGKNTIRPKYQEMMARIRVGEFTHIVVWKIDRISRNLKDFTEMYDELKEYDVAFVSKNEQFDTSSAMGEAMLKIILVFAELERKLTAERVGSIMLSRAEKGLWNGSPVPLGYDYSEELKYPVVNIEEAEVIKFIFNTYEKYRSTTEVKDILEISGIKTKNDGSWTTKTITDIIRNPFYIGTYRYNYRESGGGKRKKKDEWIIMKDNHEAIITKDLFDKVNAIMDENSTRPGGYKERTNHIHLFRGLIQCSSCGSNYISTVDKARSDGYKPSIYRCFNYVHGNKYLGKCKGSIGEVKLGPFVINYVSNMIRAESIGKNKNLSTDDLREIILKGDLFKDIDIKEEDLKDTLDIINCDDGEEVFFEYEEDKNIPDLNNNKDYKALELQKNKVEKGIERLKRLYLIGEETEEDYLNTRNELIKKLNKIQLKIERIEQAYYKNTPGHDLNFIKEATFYLINYHLSNDEFVDYNFLITIIDKTLLCDLVQTIIKKIYMRDDKKIDKIVFANGLEHNFIYE